MDYKKLIQDAFALPSTPERGSGCGRVYICFSGSRLGAPPEEVKAGKAQVRALAKAAKAAGRLFLTKTHGGGGNALYVGYDNSDGIALAKGTIMVKFFKEHGFSCYRDEQAD